MLSRDVANEAAGSAIAAFALAQVVLTCAVKSGAVDQAEAEKAIQMVLESLQGSHAPPMRKAFEKLSNFLGLMQSGGQPRKQ